MSFICSNVVEKQFINIEKRDCLVKRKKNGKTLFWRSDIDKYFGNK
jgi:hypothetical protein